MSQKKLTKIQLIKAVQDQMGDNAPSQAIIEATLDALGVAVQEKAKEGLMIEVPGIVRIKTIDKPAQPEKQKMNYFTKQMITVAAKPATKKVKAAPTKALKDALT